MKIDYAFNFDHPVQIADWTSGVVLETVAPDVGLALMLRSNRYDNDHATANVRQLHPDDAMRLNIVAVTPVVFQQLS